MSGPGPEEGDDPDMLAAEYVLGVLEPPAARALEDMARQDANVAQRIAIWEDRLTPLTQAAPALAPPPMLWLRLALATGIRTGAPEAARETTAVRAWRSAGLWRGVAGLAIAASIATFVLAPRTAPSTQFVAALVPATGQPSAFIAQVQSDGRVVLTAVSPSAVPSDRDLELWALAQGSSTPVSLGVLPAGGRVVAPRTEPGGGTQLLVSLEPRGGSPTGGPTGPVLYAGAIAPVAR